METAVISMRGEERQTESRLPVAERVAELYAFLKLSHELMPRLGFDRALAAYERANGDLIHNSGLAGFEVGAPAVRIVPHISKRLNSLDAPGSDWYTSLGT